MKKTAALILALSGPYSSQLMASGNDVYSVAYETFQRLNKPTEKNRNEHWLDLHLDNRLKHQYIEARGRGDLRYYLKGDTSISVGELYLQYNSPTESTYTVGRKILDWHPNERFWQLGHLNGQRGFRLSDTEQEGRMGFHYKTRNQSLTTEVFLSYFYIPSLSPKIKVENGEVTSPVEWAKLPPKQTIISGQEVPIYYTLNEYELKDIVLQKSLGMRMRYDWQSGAISAFSLYKPETNVRVNAEAYYDPDIDRVRVNADPVVNHHIIHGLQIEQEVLGVNVIAGATSVDPNARLGEDFDSLSGSIGKTTRNFDSDFFKIEPKYNREDYLHLSTHWDNGVSMVSTNFINYLSKHEKGSDDLYSDTVRWKRAAGLGLFHSISDTLFVKGNLRYDFIRKDNLVSSELGVRPLRRFEWRVGLEILRSPSELSYWAPYRSNDTVYTQLKYLF